jgi:hypothetical protein
MGVLVRGLVAGVSLTALYAASASKAAQDVPMLGFSPASAAAERALESRFDAALSAQAMIVPHVVV